MSLKQDYLSVLTNYEEQIKVLNTKSNALSTNTYSSEYIEKVKQEVYREKINLKRETTAKLIEILDNALAVYNNNVSSSITNNFENVEYQTGINSLIESIKANAITKEHWALIGPIYEKDNIAVKRINKAILDSESEIIPLAYIEDKTVYSIELIKNNVYTYIQINNSVDEELAIIGMKDFIQNKLDDNLIYIM